MMYVFFTIMDRDRLSPELLSELNRSDQMVRMVAKTTACMRKLHASNSAVEIMKTAGLE